MVALRIIHLDMDAFFAAVEQRDNPVLRGKPVVVGGRPDSRGVVSTASYEARKFGVHSAMPSREAYHLCPGAIFLPPDFERYSRASRQIRAIMRRYTDLIEPLSLDEAFLDVTGRDAVGIGRSLKREIREEVGLTASVGVSYNKFLAKLASDWEKPDGFTVIDEGRAATILADLPVRKLWGVGPKTEELLHSLGITTAAGILRVDAGVLARFFGRRAEELILLARGIDGRPVEPHQEAKSIGEETTFEVDEGDITQLKNILRQYADNLSERLRREHFLIRTVTIKIRFDDFKTITRSVSRRDPTDRARVIYTMAEDLLVQAPLGRRKVRLIGLQVSNIVHPGEPVQLTLNLF